MSDMQDAIRKAGFRQGSRNPKQGKRPDRGGGYGGPPRTPLPEFPKSYFGSDAQGQSYLLPDFVSKKNVDPVARHLGKEAWPNLTTGQMRRFFNHCREIERQLKVERESWHRVSARFESLCSHAQYAASANKIPPAFRDFIDSNVKRVSSSKDPGKAFLEGFLPHFEALVGFGAAYLKKDS